MASPAEMMKLMFPQKSNIEDRFTKLLQLKKLKGEMDRTQQVRDIMSSPEYISGDTDTRKNLFNQAGRPIEAQKEAERGQEMQKMEDEDDWQQIYDEELASATNQDGVVDQLKFMMSLNDKANSPAAKLQADTMHSNYMTIQQQELNVMRDTWLRKKDNLDQAFVSLKVGDHHSATRFFQKAMPEANITSVTPVVTGEGASKQEYYMVTRTTPEGPVTEKMSKMAILEVTTGDSAQQLELAQSRLLAAEAYGYARGLKKFAASLKELEMHRPRPGKTIGDKKVLKLVKAAIKKALNDEDIDVNKDWFGGVLSDVYQRDVENLVSLSMSKGGGYSPQNDAYEFSRLLALTRVNPSDRSFMPLTDLEKWWLDRALVDKALDNMNMHKVVRELMRRNLIRDYSEAGPPEEGMGPSLDSLEDSELNKVNQVRDQDLQGNFPIGGA